MEQLDDTGVGEHSLEARCRVITGRQLHKMRVPVPRRELHEAQPVAIRIEPHRLGVDSNSRSEADTLGKITVVELVGHSARRRAAVPPARGGAQEKTRTSTSFRPLEPESSASTNSATWASPDTRK